MKNRRAKNKFGHTNVNQSHQMAVNLARHNLEVTLKRTKEQCFRAAKQCGLESFEEFKKMDTFVRSQYADEPKKMAEWDTIAQKYEFMYEEDLDKEVADEEQQD